jgi:hypothetical protein
MKETLESLYKYCETGTAETEVDFLEDAFVAPLTYSEIIATPARAAIARG